MSFDADVVHQRGSAWPSGLVLRGGRFPGWLNERVVQLAPNGQILLCQLSAPNIAGEKILVVGLSKKPFEELEQLVAKIQKDLAPNAEVLHDQHLRGRKSNRSRQVDVLVRDRIGQYEIQIVVDCKDYKRPVDVKAVEEFNGLLEDVGAQKGVLVCPVGFTRSAKVRAEGLQVELYSPVDTDPHKWQARVEIPALCDFRAAAMSFGVLCSAPEPFLFPMDLFSTVNAFDRNNNDLGNPFKVAVQKWNRGVFPDDVGVHEKVPIFDDAPVQIDNGLGQNRKVPVDLYANMRVQRDLYFGQLPITRISGFKDEIRGGVITNAFEVGILTPEEIEANWRKIGDEAEAPISPVIRLVGRVVWPV